jgi:hypothetical protein
MPIVCTEEAECELVAMYRRFHCIVVRPCNTVVSEPDIAIDLLGHEAFEKALAAMGIEGNDAERLARESGRSPTILRPALRGRRDQDAPMGQGCGDREKPGPDGFSRGMARKIKCRLRDRFHTRGLDLSRDRKEHCRLLQFDDCPISAAGQYRGVASKIDALFAISKSVIEKDLAEFFMLAEYVLSESDPALDLPEDQRWAAELYGKIRDHSAALREGVCETLVVLSVHGNNLFRDRLGIDVEARVSSLIRRLLEPVTLDKLFRTATTFRGTPKRRRTNSLSSLKRT